MQKKSFFAIVLTLCLVFTGLLWLNQDVSMAANETGVVTASKLNVRTGPSTSNDKLTSDGANVQLTNGTKVTILETLTGWYKVSFAWGESTLTGYVSADYIAIETENPTASPSATPTVAPTATPTPVISYRTEVSYQDIKVAATISKKNTPLYKKANGKRYTVSKKIVTLNKNKKVNIIGEKLVKNKKWFKITFQYKKKKRTAFVRSDYVKMTLKKAANAKVFNVKKAVKVYTKKGPKPPYKMVDNKIVKIEKNAIVSILKEKTATNGVEWYQVSFIYNNKTMKGYVNAKYVKLAKKKVTKKVPVTALSDEEFEAMLTQENFPESYKASLRMLHEKYPYWQFKAFHTGLDWNTALTEESALGLNLISNAKSAAWKSKEKGAYNATTGKWKVFDGSTWVAASQEAIAYYMDPRNFLNENAIFQFESLEYQSQYQTKTGVNVIISNTPFYKKTFKYKEPTAGAEKNMYYVTAFMKAAKYSGVSPYHLASRVKQEVVTGATSTSSAVSGTHSTYPGIYNFYNIGATSSSNPVANGLKWASTGTTYMRPWTDPYRSLLGGAEYIGSKYIKKGQNTGYLQKFNVTASQTYSHQYMTNVEAATAEALKTKKAYEEMMDKSPLVFSIPVYLNMPATKCASPK